LDVEGVGGGAGREGRGVERLNLGNARLITSALLDAHRILQDVDARR
jgi:hypothetical protein